MPSWWHQPPQAQGAIPHDHYHPHASRLPKALGNPYFSPPPMPRLPWALPPCLPHAPPPICSGCHGPSPHASPHAPPPMCSGYHGHSPHASPHAPPPMCSGCHGPSPHASPHAPPPMCSGCRGPSRLHAASARLQHVGKCPSFQGRVNVVVVLFEGASWQRQVWAQNQSHKVAKCGRTITRMRSAPCPL